MLREEPKGFEDLHYFKITCKKKSDRDLQTGGGLEESKSILRCYATAFNPHNHPCKKGMHTKNQRKSANGNMQ